MVKYILKRFAYMLMTMFVVATITFFLMHSIPGDPFGEMLQELPPDMKDVYLAKYGLDQPLFTQYTVYMKNLLTKGDFGESLVFPGRSINKIIFTSMPVSGRIGLQGLAFGIPLGLILGIIAAYQRGKAMDFFVMFTSLLSLSIPSFVFAAVLQYFLAFKFKLFPISGWEGFAYTILPSLAYGIRSIGVKARFMRTSWLDVMGQDYVLAAEASGISRLGLTFKVILRNAMTPIVTILVPELAMIFTGTFVLELIFSIPGLGTYFIGAVSGRDYPMIIGQTIFVSSLYIFAMFLVDILYMIIDPRVRLDK